LKETYCWDMRESIRTLPKHSWKRSLVNYLRNSGVVSRRSYWFQRITVNNMCIKVILTTRQRTRWKTRSHDCLRDYFKLNLWVQLGLGRYGQQPYRYIFDTDLADTIRFRYTIHMYVTKGLKSRILDFNNKVNDLGWCIRLI